MSDTINDTIITINDIIEKYNLSRATINRFIKKNNIKPIKNIGRVNYYNINDFDKINKKKYNISSNYNESKKENDIINDTISDTINEYIKTLKEQLEIKDNQIKELQKIIDQQQKLTLLNSKHDTKENKELKNEKKKLKILFWKKIMKIKRHK